MKIANLYLFLALTGTSAIAYSQVGINTITPQASLDVMGSASDTSVKDGIIAPRITKQQLASKVAGTYAAPQSGALVYVSDASVPTGTTPSLSQVANVNTIGYYFFNGTVWVNVNDGAGSSVNIYNSNGTLTGNRTVTTTGYQLGFVGPSNSTILLNTGTTESRIVNNGTVRASLGLTSGTSAFNVFQDNANLAQITTEGASTGLNITTLNATPLNFLTNGASRVTVTSAGSVGVGLVTPLSRFHVDGGESRFSSTTSSWALAPTTGGVTGSSNSFEIIDRVNNVRRMVFNDNGDMSFGGAVASNSGGGVVSIRSLNVGIGTATPTNKLHINATDPLRLEGTTVGNTTTDRLMVADTNGVVKTIGTLGALSIPNPAIFRLETSQSDFLNGVGAGSLSVIPMTVVKNSIPGLAYNSGTSTITFPAGTYQMTVVYEATHDSSGCTISSYIVDFPLNSTTTRVHNTASHVAGGGSNHGGTITYATTVPAGTNWQIRLGRGQSGNCSGPGMNLAANSTQLLVFRIGD